MVSFHRVNYFQLIAAVRHRQCQFLTVIYILVFTYVHSSTEIPVIAHSHTHHQRPGRRPV